MGNKRKNDDKQTAKLALIAAILALITQLLVVVEKLVEWAASS